MTKREYLERILQVKPLVLAEPIILRNIRNAFQHRYEKAELSDKILDLGSGTTHQIYGVGCISNSSLSRELYLALRIMKDDCLFPFMDTKIQRDRFLQTDLKAYEGAFLVGRNPPYFAAMVKVSSACSEYQGCSYLGILTEDISCGKTRRVLGDPDGSDEDFVRRRPDGSLERFFLDPLECRNFPKVDSQAYFTEKYSIEIP